MQHVQSTALDYRPRARAGNAAHLRWFAAGLLLPLIGGGIAYRLTSSPDAILAPELGIANISAHAVPEIPIPELVLEVETVPLGDTVEFIVRRNDTMERIFRQLELSLQDLANVRDLPDVRRSLDSIRPGDVITFVHVDGLLQGLTRRINETSLLSVKREETGFTAQVIETPLEIRPSSVRGRIDSSLFASARAAGLSPDLIMRLANDIFGWDIDFALEIQPGDQYSIVYEQKYRDGKFLGDGDILAAEFVNAGRTYRAVRYESADGEIANYFTPEGRSMHKQFLRAPVDFTRISSNFNPARRHPILNTIRAHKGVDYAAPTGTPIRAAGDGRISFLGVKGGYGNVMILEHGAGISTLYGHMSRFAKGKRSGSRVRQGETIGFVGRTGAATGPHLHYEYRVNGAHKNPRTVPLPNAAPIPQEYLADFQSRSGPLLAQLDRSADAVVAALPAP